MKFLLFFILSVIYFKSNVSFKSFRLMSKAFLKSSQLFSAPLELEGQLNPANSWDVKFIFKGVEKVVKVPEDSSILESSEKIFDGVMSSCRNGVCTTCAGQVNVNICILVIMLSFSLIRLLKVEKMLNWQFMD